MSYAFRTIVAITYGLGSLLSWALRWLYEGGDGNIASILVTYALMGTVLLCLLDLPERLLPPGTVDIVVCAPIIHVLLR